MATINFISRGITVGTRKFPVPDGVTATQVELWGGGGGGGGLSTDNTICRGGGGAGGQYSKDTSLAVTAENSYPIVTGAGGTAGAGATNGGAGGDTYFNTTTDVVARGGAGGQSYDNGYQAGAGTTVSGKGDSVYAGGSGSAGGTGTTGGAGGGGAGSGGTGTNASGNTGGAAKADWGGTGAAGRTTSANGNAGGAYGAGGGGGANIVNNLTTNRSGGAGGAGAIRLTFDYAGSKPVMVGSALRAEGTTSATIPDINVNTTIAAGDLLVLAIASKHGSAIPSTPSGWTALTNYTQSGGDSGQEATVDRGTARATVFVKEAAGTETTTALSLTSGNSMVGTIYVFKKPSWSTWEYECVNGSDNTGGASWSVTAGSELALVKNDVVFVVNAINTDGRTFSSPSISATGATFSGNMAIDEIGTTQGNDCKLYTTLHPVSSSSEDATAAPTFTATASASTTYDPQGAAVFLKIRAVLAEGTSDRSLYTTGKDTGNSEHGLYATGANPAISTLQDDFNDASLDTSKWSNWSGARVTESGGTLNIATTTSAIYSGIDSQNAYDLTGSSIYVQLNDAGNLNLTSLEDAFVLKIDDNNRVFFNISGYDGTIAAYKQVSGSSSSLASATYSSTNHKWLRFRESSGTLYWETSADATNWNVLYSEASPITITSLKVSLVAGTWDTEASTTTVKYDNVNITPSTSANSERSLYGTGKASDNSERSLYVKGQSSDNSARSLYASANDLGNSERGLYLSGNASDTSERNLYAIANVTDNSTRNLYLSGFDTGSDNRGLYASANESDSSSYGLYATGIESGSSEHNIYALGYSADNSEQTLYATAAESGLSERSLYAKGVGQDGSEKSLYATAEDNDLSDKNIYAIGRNIDNSIRGIYGIGSDIDNSESGLYGTGNNTEGSDRNVYANGFDTDTSEMLLYATAIDIDASTRGLFAIGIDSPQSDRNLYAVAEESNNSEKGLYAIGVIVETGERALYAEGYSDFDYELKRWNGSAWEQVNLKRYSGSSWVTPTMKLYNGGWKTIKVSP